MGPCLIGVVWDWSLLVVILELLVVILEVAVALGMVIFVHELGHFLVAKLCGVKCEKFYLGFDIYGLKLCKFRWGETEYGIGILPLGGYVKMLGQEDNPARLREEIERAKLHDATGVAPVQGTGNAPAAPPAAAEANQQQGESFDVAAAEQALYNPRSYLAKSVPQRMAIISAGVIMNVIFAFVCATIAYGLGVKQIAPGVGYVFPGEAAWKAGLRVGDEIQEIGGQEVTRFKDVLKGVTLGDNIHEGIPLLIRRPGVEKPLTITVTPDVMGSRLAPTIGVGSPYATTLSPRVRPTAPGSSAAQAEPEFERGDRVIKIDDTPVETYAQIEAYLAEHVDQPITVTIQRPWREGGATDRPEPAKSELPPAEKRIAVTVAPNPMRQFGIEMTMGKICAVEVDSPAEKAGLREHDLLVEIDGGPVGDPMTLPYRLRRRTGETITLGIEREGSEALIRVQVTLRRADWYEQPLIVESSPMSVPQLGIAYRVASRIARVEPGGPAQKAGLKAGDVVAKATRLPLKTQTTGEDNTEKEAITLPYDEKELNWAFFTYYVQATHLGTSFKLQLEDGSDVTLEPVPATAWYNPNRGFRFEAERFTERAKDPGDAMRLGGRETWESLTMVVAFLRKVGTQISPKGMGGPGTIAVLAGHAAYEGLPALLIFLAMISANLAIINFLPIPLLDGGHIVFLTWEGIRGKPADERIQLALTYLGLAFILALMLWVIGLDVTRLFRGW